MQKTLIACCIGALFASGTAVAGDQLTVGDKNAYAGEGAPLTIKSQTLNEKSQITGGWWHYQSLATDTTNFAHAGATSDLTIDLANTTALDEVMGGNCIKLPSLLDTSKAFAVSMGDTKVTVKGGSMEYLLGGSKANNAGKGSITNGNTTLVVENADIKASSDITKGVVVGGNYIKATAAGGGRVSQTTSTVGDTNVLIKDGTVGGSVYGGSFAENYASVDTPEMDLKITTGNASMTINGGTFNGHVVGASGATGQGTSAKTASASLTLKADKAIMLSDKSILIGGDYLANRGKSTIDGDVTVVVTGDSAITLGKGIVGGSCVYGNKRGSAAVSGGTYTASTIKGDVSILVDAAKVTVKDEIIGGSYLRQTAQDSNDKITATVANTNLTLKAGTYEANIFAGGKSNDNLGDLASNVEGDTALTISGGEYKAAVFGGGSAKAGQGDAAQKRLVAADVNGTARVNVSGGTLNGVVGGGLSYIYFENHTNTAVSTEVGSVVINVTGGTLGGTIHNSGIDKFPVEASLIGGGLAYTVNPKTGNKVSATVDSVDMTIAGKDVKVEGNVYAGGFAVGGTSNASVTSTKLAVSDTVLGEKTKQIKVFAGGYADNGATAAVESADMTITKSTINGDVYGGGYVGATGTNNVTVGDSVITLANSTVTGTVSTESFKAPATAPAARTMLRAAAVPAAATPASTAATPAAKATRTINIINSKIGGAVDISADANTQTSLYLEGVNSAGSFTGGQASDIVFDGTGTPEGGAILTLTGDNATFDMSGDKTLVAQNVNSGTMLVKGSYKTAADTTLTLTNDFGVVVYNFGDSPIENADLLLSNQGLVIGSGENSTTIGAADVTISGNTKTLSEAQLGSVAFVTQGAEFVADEGMRSIRAAARDGAFTAFGAMAGGYNRYETGSHVDVKGVSLAAGTAGRIDNLTLAGFIEAGWASSESHVASAQADADHDYYGVGAAMRYDFAEPFYLDGAVRFGKVSTDFDGTYSTSNAKYDADGLYASAHVGAGYVFDLARDIKLDAYGRYLFSYVEGDNVTLESKLQEGFSMDDMTAHAVRLGVRLDGTLEAFDWYAGLAYEHVFDGKAEGELKFGGATAALDVPSLKGNSAVFDFGFTMKPEASGPWTIGVGVKGYAGDRRGGTGSVNVLYTF